MGNAIKRQTHKFSPLRHFGIRPKKSAETRTDLIKGNFIDIASAKFGVKLHGIFYLFLTKSGAFAKTG